ncbi:sulfatase-like hydrolase/transferase [Haloarcula japonica]|uniref:N-acetylgalactosamine-4-sulfatase n=1 Tax=Haloarcula japonica (strain ATCC 49778 / DSM 6131 / JCM 7785 / NBRC 101032 / NCIMB 13157 / TR-1) TaxID=1227453 RepID=M0L5A1_HALJT|nr:sulfatase-like hydrolase/transferase [Haloarcula japonica]EMA27160.1 N-acetylgalactosamine-4-sulfatase [Haloarcula japonica DSM 6131]
MDLDVENVLIYVDDAVRYDTIADTLSSFGPTHKTIAASTHTPTSFGSLLTGLLPPRSGIHSFKHTVPHDVRSVFDIDTHETSMGAKGGMNDGIADIFNSPSRTTIEEANPPFVHVVRRPGGHAPYNGFEWDQYEYASETADEYFERISTQPVQAQTDYKQGVERSFEEFQRVLDVLDERGLADDTLVVYTSDHGELLGEYGFFGHTHAATPEVVYVPTTFIHPDLEPENVDDLFHHVDLVPTIADAMRHDIDIGQTDGFIDGGDRETGYNHLRHIRYGTLADPIERLIQLTGGFERTIQSIWDDDGGHVFVEGSQITASLVYLVLLLQKPFGKQVRYKNNIVDSYKMFTPGHESYGLPGFDKQEARSKIDSILARKAANTERDIDDATVEHLEEMGYI